MAQCSMRTSTLTRSWSQRLLSRRGYPIKGSASTFSSSTCVRGAAGQPSGSILASDNNGSGKSNGNQPPAQQEPLTLWHKTSKILPKALENPVSSSTSTSTSQVSHSLPIETWEGILSRSFDDLSGSSARPIKLVVHGIDEHSGSEDFVTALVADPLGSPEHFKAVQGRWKDQTGRVLTVSHGTQLSVDIESKTFSLPSPYLQRFDVPIQLTELRSSSKSSKSPILDQSILSRLYEAEIPILLCNPLTTPLSSLLSIPLPQGTIIVIRAPNADTTPDLTQQLLSNVPSYAPKPTIILADPSRASKAIEILQSNDTGRASSSVIQRFQDEFTGSNISSVTNMLQDLLSSPAPSPSTSRNAKPPSTSDLLRTRFALMRLEDALTAGIASLESLRFELDKASVDASRLYDQVEETGAKVEFEVLGPATASAGVPSSSGSTTGHEATDTPLSRTANANQVTEALKQAEKQMQEVMSSFTWWRMIWRVDEITNLVASALERAWCPELERKLLLQTGILSSLQSSLSKRSFTLLSSTLVLQSTSAVLHNSLLQLQRSPSYTLTTTSLTSAITSRRTQIVNYPTTRLHLAGQRSVLGMSGGVISGAALGWTGWMGWLVQNGANTVNDAGIWGLNYIGLEPNTAMGLGALIAAGSIRWGVGKWERAKKKWWEDWHRVGEGLDRELRTTLHRTYKDRVSILARTSADGVKSIVERRENDLVKVNDEVVQLREDVRGVVGSRS